MHFALQVNENSCEIIKCAEQLVNMSFIVNKYSNHFRCRSTEYNNHDLLYMHANKLFVRIQNLRNFSAISNILKYCSAD